MKNRLDIAFERASRFGGKPLSAGTSVVERKEHGPHISLRMRIIQQGAIGGAASELPPGGPGTELKKILGIIGIKPTKSCQCEARALKMDREGPEWCRQNMNTILGWLEEEAKKRGLPFVRTVAKAMVNLAIRRAEKKNEPLVAVDFQPGEASPISWISTSRLVEDTMRLCSKLPPDIDAVVGVARSGMLPATHIATMRHVPLYVTSVDRTGRPSPIVHCGHGCRMTGYPKRPPRRVLIVDDTARGGWSASHLRDHVAKFWPMAKVETCAVYVHPDARGFIDYPGEIYNCHHFLEWNLFNASILSMMASDLDGILCDEKTGLPLQWPRHRPIPLIITGRPRWHRSPTIAWLRKHRIAYSKLEMGPWSKVPSEEKVAEWKARVLSRTDFQFFIESSPEQAKIIRKLSGRQVLCPAAGGLIP